MNDSLSKILAPLSITDQLALVEAIDKKRKEDHYIRYWSTVEGGARSYPQQAAIFKEFTPDIKIFGVLGGNRSGKTEVGAFIATAWALGKRYFEGDPAYEYIKDLPIPEPGNNVWVVGLDYPTLRDVIWREKLRFGRNHPPLVPKDSDTVIKTNDSDYQIFFSNGSIITGKSADSGREKFQGASVDLVWIDEEPDVEIYDECYQRTSDCAGKILLTLTPLADISSGVKEPWVYDLYEESIQGKSDVKFVKLSVLDNPYVPEEEKLKLREKWSGHYAEKARLYGDFCQRSGLVYNMWDKSKHLIPPFKVPRGIKRIVSIDPASTGTTAAVGAAIYPNGDVYLYREYYERDAVVSDHAKNLLVRFGDAPIDIWLIDPKWCSQRLADTHKTGLQLYRDAGIPVRPAQPGEDYGLNTMREYLNATTVENSRHPKMKVFSDLKNFIFEIEHYVWALFGVGEQKGLSKDKPTKRNDHLMNATQYLLGMHPRGIRLNQPLTGEAATKFAELNSYS